jgi:Flp pilus assembly protein TadD
LYDFPRAAKLATQATELVPDSRFFWQTLGAVRYRLRDWAGARSALQQADQLRPTEAGLGTCLQAMVEWHLGNRDAARALLEETQTWSEKNRPGDEELRRFRDEAGKLVLESPSP